VDPILLYNRLTDGGKFVNRTHWPHSASQNHYFSTSGNHFCYKPHGLVRPEGVGKLNKFIPLIESRTRDLPDCSIVP
jgi:hypothetical protein